jgi:hypothetical protein
VLRRHPGQPVALSSISVTRAAIGDRSDRVKVTWANNGCPLNKVLLGGAAVLTEEALETECAAS